LRLLPGDRHRLFFVVQMIYTEYVERRSYVDCNKHNPAHTTTHFVTVITTFVYTWQRRPIICPYCFENKQTTRLRKIVDVFSIFNYGVNGPYWIWTYLTFRRTGHVRYFLNCLRTTKTPLHHRWSFTAVWCNKT